MTGFQPPKQATYKDIESSCVDVYLNGELQHCVIFYDVDGGKLGRLKHDMQGNHIINNDGDSFEAEVVGGHIDVRWKVKNK